MPGSYPVTVYLWSLRIAPRLNVDPPIAPFLVVLENNVTSAEEKDVVDTNDELLSTAPFLSFFHGYPLTNALAFISISDSISP